MTRFVAFWILVLLSVFNSIKQGNSTKANDNEGEDNSKNSAQRFPPFITLLNTKNLRTDVPFNFKLPSKYANTEYTELSFAADRSDIMEIPLCPELRTTDESLQEALRSLNENTPDTKGCLFVTKFQENEQSTCSHEPRAGLAVERDIDRNEVLCGVTDAQQLISAEYYNCGTENYFKDYVENASIIKELHGEELALLPEIYDMYEICYDFVFKKTLWTRHKVMTPELLAHKNYPHKDLDTVDLKEFNTDTFSLGVYEGTFADMKHEYESVNTNMKIYPLVPKEHMALPYWKKSTNHIINSAPILPEFIPLMKAIHNGILLASKYVLRKFNHILKIYTKAETIFTYKHSVSSALYLKPLMKSFMPVISTDVFRPSIWYRIVFNESTKSAVLIVLHNTKEALPAKKECDDNDVLPCYFKSWAEDPDSISQNILQNAYCCAITQEKAEKLFSILYLGIRKTLDIQELIGQMTDKII